MGSTITQIHTDPDNKFTIRLYAPLKWRIVYSIPRVINQERSMILTCGFRGKLDKAFIFHFQG